MSRKVLITLVIIVSLLLAGAVGFIVYQEKLPEPPATESTTLASTAAATQAPVTTAEATQETTLAATAAPTTEAPTTVPTTEAPTTEATTVPTQTEPKEESFVLSFVGDCTLGSTNKQYGVKYSFIDTIGTDYDYPFKNVAEYFKNDDFTFANLECILSDEKMYSDAQFSFRGPTAYTQILTGSSVEAVTLANNHTPDFGKKGLDHTKAALDEAKITYAEKNGYAIHKTESGLTIGIYGVNFQVHRDAMGQAIRNMRKQGAEVIIVAYHWGDEGVYKPTKEQQALAHDAIDIGADIVYGSHPHVLQPVETYKDGVIFYSLGNFSFGGNNWPQDLDSAILQQEVIRDKNGNIRLGKLTMIPVSCSSLPVQNNFQPTPYEEGSREYERTMSKLNGTFKGGNLVVDYGTETTAPAATTPATQAPTATEAPAVTTPPATEAPAAPPATQTPAATTPPATQVPTPDVPDVDDPQP